MMTGTFTLDVESIASDGSGVAHLDGMTVFLERTAPGDRVAARLTETHRKWARGVALRVEEAGPGRVPPVCPAYGVCGGCSLQHLDYEHQIAAKVRILSDALTRIGGFTALPVIQVTRSPAWGCRNRMQLHRRPGALGLRRRRGGEVIALADCPVADGGIRRLLAAARAPVPGTADPLPHHGRFTVYSRGDTLLVEGGDPARGEITLAGKTVILDAGVFFQSNALMQEALIRGVMAAAAQADPARAAADLYAGAGVFALFLAGRFSRVFLAEENPAALALARENLADADFYAGTAEAWAKTNLPKGGFGFVAADPPRTGLRGAANILAEAGPAVFAYVSCDPATLARDARILHHHYALASLTLYDFYPQTAHIETLAVFTRNHHA
ncbi:MAG: TRAM domain-containing protein [Spirochaetaceae bacterium]|jgi:23S rRNA (uracil1939-C5)-methyltransferase|nr:TRAM domain-containing protein [Spirochaetaceae bacterium]